MDTGKFTQRHARAILFVVFVLALGGVFAAFHLPVALFPDVTFPRIVVSAEAGEMPADRMMITVTRKLEEAVRSIPNVLDVRSITSRGACDLSINFRWNIDMVKAELLVNNAIAQIRNDLPAEFSFVVRTMSPTIAPIIGYSMISQQRSLVDLRRFAEFNLRPVLTAIEGVAKVEVLGGRTPEFQVEVNPERLRSFGLSLEDLAQAIKNTNVVAAVGKIEQDYKLYLTLVDEQYSTPEQIGQTVIKVANSMPIFLEDVAIVREGVQPEWTRVTSNGQDAVLLNVYQQPGGNTVRIDGEIKAALDKMKDRIPRDIALSKFYDQSDLIVSSMGNVRDSIIVGILLAVAILWLFLRNWKITLIASLDVPLTIAITVLIMRALNMSFNIMSLGGIAAAIGLIIDDAIVVVENTVRHLAHKSQSASEAVHASVHEIIESILGSSFSTIVVFAPLAFLTGVTGAFFKTLSLTMASALLVSLLLSLFFIPLLTSRLITESDARRQERTSRAFTYLGRHYERLLKYLLRRKSLAIVAAGVLIIAGFLLYRSLPTGFLPEMDEGTFILDYWTDPGTSLGETDRVMRQIEKVITSVPEVVSYSRRTGLQLGGALTEANSGDFLIRLNDKRSRGMDEIIDDVREKVLAVVPGVEIEFAQLMGDLIGDLTAVPQPIEIKIFGDDYQQIHAVSQKVAEEIEKVKGVVDVYNGVTIAGSSIHITVDPARAGLYGLNADAIQREAETAINGAVASQVQERQTMTGIRVILPPEDRGSLDRIKHLRFLSPNGNYVSLASVAELSIQEGAPELTRDNLKQMIAVTARLSGHDLGGTVKAVQAAINKNVSMPQNVFIEYGGLYQEQQKSFLGLAVVLVMAILLLFAVQLIEFESLRVPLVIFVVDILSLFGVFFLLRVTGTALNIASMMGMIMIVGIVAENAIFLMHYIRLFSAQGIPVHEAVLQAGHIRMRPIIMTTLAAVLALLPLAVGLGVGAQMQQPLAIAVIGGFSFSAFLLLLLLPVFYAMVFKD